MPSTQGATDGNSAPCRRQISADDHRSDHSKRSDLWIRWTDIDTAGSDDALAIDDVAIGVTTSTISINPTATGSATPTPVSPGQTVTLSGTITPGQNPTSVSFAVLCDTDRDRRFEHPIASGRGGHIQRRRRGVPDHGARRVSGSVLGRRRSGPDRHFSISVKVLLPLVPTCGAPATPIQSFRAPARSVGWPDRSSTSKAWSPALSRDQRS